MPAADGAVALATAPRSVSERVQRIDWRAVEDELASRPYARLGRLLSPAECAGLVALYPSPARFRSTVDMARHRFGAGEYRYFARPLPVLVEELRSELYERLAPIAGRWQGALRATSGHPPLPRRHADFLVRCAAVGQTRPTPLLLRYEAGGYNALHQDLYGPVAFPLQAAVFLSRPGLDYEGGDFLLVEQRPRAQSVGEAVRAEQGEAIVFATRHRPVRSARVFYAATVRHGVSRVLRGRRFTLGIPFHDAA